MSQSSFLFNTGKWQIFPDQGTGSLFSLPERRSLYSAIFQFFSVHFGIFWSLAPFVICAHFAFFMTRLGDHCVTHCVELSKAARAPLLTDPLTMLILGTTVFPVSQGLEVTSSSPPEEIRIQLSFLQGSKQENF